MTIPTLIALLLSSLALSLSIAALIAALRSSDRLLRKQFAVLSERFSAVENQVDLQNSKIKSVRAQVHNVNLSRSANREPPELTPDGIEAHKDEWTRAMNLKIARGEVRPFGR